MQKPVASDENLQLVTDILTRAAGKLRAANQVHADKKENQNVAVIVEPRCHPLLLDIIRITMHLLDDSWNLIIYHGDENKQYIEDDLKHWKFQMINLGINNLTPDQHNRLLRTREFWKAISKENILIFQTDACLLRRGIEKFIPQHFIGAQTLNPYELTPNKIGMNGGLSLRSKASMLECIDKVSIDDINARRKDLACNELPSWTYYRQIAEDVYFWHALEKLDKRLPDAEQAKSFSSEAIPNIDAFGIHGIYKKFFSFDILKKIFDNSDIVTI